MEWALETKILFTGMFLLFLTLIHWKMAIESVEDILHRKRILGNKTLWVLSILFITCAGSIAYQLAHGEERPQQRQTAKHNWDEWRY